MAAGGGGEVQGKNSFWPWYQAGHYDGEILVRTVGLRGARDYRWKRQKAHGMDGQTERQRRHYVWGKFFVTQNLAADVVREESCTHVMSTCIFDTVGPKLHGFKTLSKHVTACIGDLAPWNSTQVTLSTRHRPALLQ